MTIAPGADAGPESATRPIRSSTSSRASRGTRRREGAPRPRRQPGDDRGGTVTTYAYGPDPLFFVTVYAPPEY